MDASRSLTGGAPRSTAPARPTSGVEEEYLLLDPFGGAPVPAAAAVLALAARHHDDAGAALQEELVQPQLEIATPL